VNWDLWVHLFRAELHTLATSETRVHRAVCAGGLTFTLWDLRRELYPPCMMTSNNVEWERGWFYLCNDGAGLPPHRQGAEGEDRHLAPWRITSLALTVAGVTHRRAVESSGRQVGGGLGPRQPLPPADRAPHGEGTPHLRDERRGRPYGVGAFTVATRSLPSRIHSDEGEPFHQPQVRAARP
jgi:hypothetical protein